MKTKNKIEILEKLLCLSLLISATFVACYVASFWIFSSIDSLSDVLIASTPAIVLIVWIRLLERKI